VARNCIIVNEDAFQYLGGKEVALGTIRRGRMVIVKFQYDANWPALEITESNPLANVNFDSYFYECLTASIPRPRRMGIY
jgi:hypothetical protein